MHECPECGQACDCDGDDTWMDTDDCTHCDYPGFESDYDEDRDGFEACVDCGSPNLSAMCECCGGWLCHMHSEIGAGFCKACPTQEWIDDQNKTPMPIVPIRPIRAGLDDDLPF